MDNWYNYVTEQYETREAPTTDEEAKMLIPQLTEAQGLYVCYRQMGSGIVEAMRDTLLACVGKVDLSDA